MWDLLVSIPDHCLSFYFPALNGRYLHLVKCKHCRKYVENTTKTAETFIVVTGDPPFTLAIFTAQILFTSESEVFSVMNFHILALLIPYLVPLLLVIW